MKKRSLFSLYCLAVTLCFNTFGQDGSPFGDQPPAPEPVPADELVPVGEPQSERQHYPELEALDKAIAKVGDEKLKLILGPDWLRFNHYCDRAYNLLQLGDKEEAQTRIEKATRLLEESLKKNRLRRLADGRIQMGDAILNPATETITMPGTYKHNIDMPVEVALCGANGRIYEGSLETTARPFHITTLLQMLGVESVEFDPEKSVPNKSLVSIYLEWKGSDGKTKTIPVEKLIWNEKKQAYMPEKGWVFVTPIFSEGFFSADNHGDIAQMLAVSPPMLITNIPEISKGKVHYDAKRRPDLEPDTPITVILKKFKPAD